MKLRLIQLSAFILLCCVGHAQAGFSTATIDTLIARGASITYQYPDSAESIFLKAQEGAVRINYTKGIAAASHYVAIICGFTNRLDSAIFYYKQAIDLYLGDLKAQADCHEELAFVYRIEGRYDESLEAFRKASMLYIDAGDSISYGECLNYAGSVYRNLNYYLPALEYQLEAQKVFEAIGYTKGLVSIYNSIGIIYFEQSDWPNTIRYYQKALETQETIGKVTSMNPLIQNNLGEVFLETGEYKQAAMYLTASMKLSKQIGDVSNEAYASTLLAVLYEKQDDETRAFHYANEALNKISADMQLQSICYRILSKYYFKNGEVSKAKRFALQSLANAKERYDREYLEALMHWHQLLNATGQHQKAYDVFQEYSDLQNEILSEKNTRELAVAEANFHFQKEKDSMQFANAQQKLVLETEIAQRSTNQKIILILLILAIITIAIFMFLYRQLNHLVSVIRMRNKEIVRQRDHLEKLNRTKTRFFSIISHDLRNPLSALLSFNRLIKMHLTRRYDIEEDKKLEEISHYQEESANSVIALLDGLIKWALKEEGVMPYYPELLNLKSLVEESIQDLKAQAIVKSIDLTLKIDEPISAWIDKNSMMTILRNLTSNALKFTPKRGTVIIEAWQENNHVKMIVEDNGVGIAPERIKRIFDIGEKKTTWGTEGEKGFGIGLNIVSDFVKMNKGDIIVESELNKGTRFVMTFPLEQQVA